MGEESIPTALAAALWGAFENGLYCVCTSETPSTGKKSEKQKAVEPLELPKVVENEDEDDILSPLSCAHGLDRTSTPSFPASCR